MVEMSECFRRTDGIESTSTSTVTRDTSVKGSLARSVGLDRMEEGEDCFIIGFLAEGRADGVSAEGSAGGISVEEGRAGGVSAERGKGGISAEGRTGGVSGDGAGAGGIAADGRAGGISAEG